jgi:transcriptional regulator with XRE-family HTH domain
MADDDTLYRVIGARIRDSRKRSAERFSQARLAKHLDVSRASIVNIEAGRQHAPLHLLWRIAEVLGTDLVSLIPRRTDLLPTERSAKLNDVMRKQIKSEAGGNTSLEKKLTGIVGRLLTTIETDPTS